MLKQMNSKNNLFNIMSNSLIKLPTPLNISYMWSFGSILGVILIMQLLTGVLWATTYSPSMKESFLTTYIMMQTLDKLWLIRFMHLNGASLFFMFMYLHMLRGMFYMSFLHKHTWNSGVTILLLSMATAFAGYVLPMNQMSFWAASVITNLFSELPYIGKETVILIWGGPAVMNPTLTRLYAVHFFLPFTIIAMVMIHLVMIHSHTSSNPLGYKTNSKLQFHPNLVTKDVNGFLFTWLMILMLIMDNPVALMDKENFINADPLSTPLHIKPEWYFLFAYAILRCIPNKFGGVLALLMAVMILYSLPITHTYTMMKNKSSYPLNNIIFWVFVANIMLLTLAGVKPVEEPYITGTQIMALIYFMYFILSPMLIYLNDKFIFNKM